MKTKLRYPKGIRFPREDEVPSTVNFDTLKDEFDNADIVTGFKIMQSNTREKFTFFAECNVQPTDLWELFVALAGLLPDIGCNSLISIRDDIFTESKNTTRQKCLEKFKNFQFELCNDGFIEFGVISKFSTVIEVLVTKSKYIRYWGSNEGEFRAVMSNHHLEENKGLRFFDEFPMIVEPLRDPHQEFLKVYEHVTNQW